MTSLHEPAVLVLLRDREAVARLKEALRPGGLGAPPQAGAGIHCVRRVTELRTALDERPYGLVIVEQRDVDGTPTDEMIRAVRERYPATVVVGYAPVKRGMSSDVLAFARAGAHELVMGGVDDVVVALRTALAQATQRSTTDRLLGEVVAAVPRAAAPLVRLCLERATEATSVPDIARAFGITRQTLVARTRAAGLPAPHEVMTWCKLLLAAQRLVETGRVEQTAIAFDFASPNAFRNLLRRYTKLGPSDVIRDGVEPVLAAFREAIEHARANSAARRVPQSSGSAPGLTQWPDGRA